MPSSSALSHIDLYCTLFLHFIPSSFNSSCITIFDDVKKLFGTKIKIIPVPICARPILCHSKELESNISGEVEV